MCSNPGGGTSQYIEGFLRRLFLPPAPEEADPLSPRSRPPRSLDFDLRRLSFDLDLLRRSLSFDLDRFLSLSWIGCC